MWYSVSGGMEFENVGMTYFLRQALLQRVITISRNAFNR